MSLTLLDGFEDGDVAEWSVNDPDFEASTERARTGSYSGGGFMFPSNYVIASRSLRTTTDTFELYFNEDSGSNGGGYELFDEDGNRICAFGTANPQWIVADADGGAEISTGDGYDRWIHVRIELDLVGGVTYEFYDPVTDLTVTETRNAESAKKAASLNIVCAGTEFDLRDRTIGRDTYQWTDDIGVEGLIRASAGTAAATEPSPTLSPGGVTSTLSRETVETVEPRVGAKYYGLIRASTATMSAVQPPPTATGGPITKSMSLASLTTAEPSTHVNFLMRIRATPSTLTTTEPSSTVTSGPTTQTFSTEQVSAVEPSPTMVHSQFPDISTETLSSVEPALSMGAGFNVGEEQVSVGEPPVTLRIEAPQTLSLSTGRVSTQEPGMSTVTDSFGIGGGTDDGSGGSTVTPVSPGSVTDGALDVIGVNVEYDRIGLTWRVSKQNLDQLRQFKSNAGDYEKRLYSTGRWDVIDTSLGANNTYSVNPPANLSPPLRGREVVVDSYSEQSGAGGWTRTVDIEFVLTSERNVGLPYTETAASDEWSFEFWNGTIATRRVTVSEEGGEDVVNLQLELEPEQAQVVFESARVLDSVNEVVVPDGDDFVRDTSPEAENTVVIARPDDLSTEFFPVEGEYVVMSWSSGSTPPPFWDVSLTVRKT